MSSALLCAYLKGFPSVLFRSSSSLAVPFSGPVQPEISTVTMLPDPSVIAAPRLWASCRCRLARIALLLILALPMVVVTAECSQAQPLKSLHTFLQNVEGANPEAALLPGNDGFLYGTTANGGINGKGTLYKIQPDGSGFVTLYAFSGIGSDGATPYAGLLLGNDGALYGTTQYGGDSGHGVVFKIKPDGSGFAVLHSFSGIGGEGAYPRTALIQDKNGILYGTTDLGGNGKGTLFKIKLDGSDFETLYAFSQTDSNLTNSDGAVPEAALLLGKDGFLYGTTLRGGANTNGTLFKIMPDGSGFVALYTFSQTDGNFSNSDGAHPRAGLIQDEAGVLYGTTYLGGIDANGTLFRINSDGSNFMTLYAFSQTDNLGINNDGSTPQAALLLGKDGFLYGTTATGGINGTGTVFKIQRDSSGFVSLYSFGKDDGSSINTDGTEPVASLIQRADGFLYGTTQRGGTDGSGTLFRLSPNAFLGSLDTLAVSPPTVTGGQQNPHGTVTLSEAAPLGGIKVSLSSSNLGVATVPASVTVPQGATKAIFIVTTKKVPANVTSRITASYNGVSKSVSLTVTPSVLSLSSLTVSPGAVVGGQQNARAKLTLAEVAPAGGATVTLQSNHPGVAAVPASVIVPAGYVTVSFTVTSKGVSASTSVAVTATLGHSSKTATLTVLPPALAVTGLSLTPNPAAGGQQNPTGTVTLSRPAPMGGANITLTSGNPGAATVPATFTVPQGATTATFTVTTKNVPASVTSRITASLNSSSQQVVLTVTK